MISYAEALQLLRNGIVAGTPRRMPLDAAAGSVTATELCARLAVPGFANAAMDGFAVHSAATLDARTDRPVHLAIAGLVAAGQRAPAAGSTEVAWEIFTGAPLPAGCDAVVPVERVLRPDLRPGELPQVAITAPAYPGQNVREAGQDFRAGQVVLPAGTRLGPHQLMGLAACGVDELAVRPAPRVALLVTGNELAVRGAPLLPGQIHDANGPYLRALLPALGAVLTGAEIVGDTPDALRDCLLALADTADVVLTTGGVSAGRLDLLPAVVRALGGEILFHKVAIRPGKPVLHARLPGGTLLFGLPGNPLAVAVGMRFFVIPALRALQGLPPEIELPAACLEPVRGRGALRFFAKARVSVEPSARRVVCILPGQESFRIAPLLQANCWAIVPEGVDELPAGGTLLTLPLYPADVV